MDCTACTGCSWHLARAPNTRSFPVIDELRFNNVTGPGEQQSGLEEMQIHSDPPSLTSMEAAQCKCDPYWLHGWPDFSTLTSRSAHEKIFFFQPPLFMLGSLSVTLREELGDHAQIFFIIIISLFFIYSIMHI